MATLPELSPLASRSVVGVRVRFYETDLMGIVHHASYVQYLEVARVEWLRRRGVTYASWAANGLHLPVVEVNLKYRAPARFDDELEIETTLSEVRAASIRFDYLLYRISNVSERTLCVEGSTRLACVDGRHALRRFTREIVEALTRGEL